MCVCITSGGGEGLGVCITRGVCIISVVCLIQKRSFGSGAADLNALRLRGGCSLSLLSGGRDTLTQLSSSSGGAGGCSGAPRRLRLGLTLAEQGAEREVGNGGQKGSNPCSAAAAGSSCRAKGSQSGEGNRAPLENGLVGEGRVPSRGLAGPLEPRGRSADMPADTKLQGSMRGRLGEGRGRGMMLTSRRRVLGLQRRGSGYRANGSGLF